MHILIQLLKFRLLQTHRLFKDAGYFLVLAVSVLALSILARGFVLVVESDPISYAVGSLIVILFIHYQRKDQAFLKSLFKSVRQLMLFYFFEYFLLQFLFLVLFIVTNLWIKILMILLVALVVSLIGIHLTRDYQISNKKISLRFIPLQLFEVKFFFERQPIILLLLLALVISCYVHFAFFFILVFILSMCIGSSFTYLEDRSMIEWTKNFVAKKIISNLIAAQVFLLPALLLTCLSTIDHFFWYLGGYFIAILNICMFISYKYRTYRPDRILVGSSSVLSVFILFNFLPGLFLISLVYTGINYIRAERNMNYYYA